MLQKIRSLPAYTILITGCVFLIGLNFIPAFFEMSRMDYSQQVLSGSVEPDLYAIPNDTARHTYEEFKQREKELYFKRSLQEEINRGSSGSGLTSPLIGYEEFKECYTCPGSKTTHHYLVLSGYALKDKESKFYMQNGEPYLAYPIWSKVDTASGGWLSRNGHYEHKPLPFRFSYNNKELEAKEQGRVLISISPGTYKYFATPVLIVTILAGLGLVYLCLALPIKVLVRVASGEVFTPQNLQQLYLTAFAWLIPPFAIILLQFIFRWIFHRYITNDVQLTPWASLQNMQAMLIIGLVILTIAQAFKEGLTLQKEQDLTI